MKEQKLSLNKNINYSVFLTILYLFVSCSDKKEKIPQIDFENKTQVLETVKKFYNKDVDIAVSGLFDEAGKQYILTGDEINNSEEWGIKFAFLEKSENGFEPKFETDLLEGSFSESLVDKIKIPSFDYDLGYYNSQGYFLGSGGGEVFAYILDYQNKQVYYAHLVAESESSVSLFISDNTKNKEIINFFKFAFKKDYQSLVLVKDDIVIE